MVFNINIVQKAINPTSVINGIYLFFLCLLKYSSVYAVKHHSKVEIVSKVSKLVSIVYIVHVYILFKYPRITIEKEINNSNELYNIKIFKCIFTVFLINNSFEKYPERDPCINTINSASLCINESVVISSGDRKL